MRTYAFAGASQRALFMYAKPLLTEYAHQGRIVGVFDINPLRAKTFSQWSGGVPVFADFDRLLAEARPDVVIVTTVDATHHDYIIRSLTAGCEVITEKPMTTDAEKCRAILAAERATGRTVTVTFNYRFMPYVTRAKELIRAGAIGRVRNVDFEWLLDRTHGADYFRRWHRRKQNSGGLLVHKATHHFDLVNWWLDDTPQTVFAFGSRQFYGPTRAERGQRCSTCGHTRTCEFYVDYAANPVFKSLYFEAESADGYWRDQCVFADEIDIEDTMSVTVRYAKGAQLAYSLIAYSPYEGWRASLTGDGGRLELAVIESGPEASAQALTIAIYTPDGRVRHETIPVDPGGHGGGDERLLERLFSGRTLPDPLGHMADAQAGARAMLIGAAANQSIATGRAIESLLPRTLAVLPNQPPVKPS
jgi:predicted dehydrogenase